MAEHRDPRIDVVGPGELRPADPARFSLAPVDEELELEVPPLPGPGAIVAEGGPLRPDRGLEEPARVLADPARGLDPDLLPRLRGIDLRGEERLVGVDVPDPDHVLLVHQDPLDRRRAL